MTVTGTHHQQVVDVL